jgi:hypothetical protein
MLIMKSFPVACDREACIFGAIGHPVTPHANKLRANQSSLFKTGKPPSIPLLKGLSSYAATHSRHMLK